MTALLRSLSEKDRRHPAGVPRRPWAAEAWRAGAVAAVWGTSLFVVALWVAGGGLQSLVGGAAAVLESAGRITGLVASNLLLLQVLLMARVPVFERGFGRDGLTRAHRLVGFWSFWMMLAHVALITAGYAAAAEGEFLGQLLEFVVDYPGMLLATTGTLLLLAVVALSLRGVRRRTRYESWHLLHLYGYLGVGLALPHQLWTGADFLASPAATAYWWTLWAVVAACVLWFRLLQPVLASLRHRLRVVEVLADGPRGVTVRVGGRDVARMRASAGQFFVWRFLDGPGWSRGHPFSLSGAPGDVLELTASIVGDGTRRLAALRPGTRVLVEGPYGGMTGERRRTRRLLMLGAGAGVAPLVALLEEQPWAAGEAVLVSRDHDPSEGLLTARIRDLVRDRGLRWFRVDGPRARTGASWLPIRYQTRSGVEVLRRVAGDGIRESDVYLCGPSPWMASLRRDLAAVPVPAERIHAESFSS